MRRTKPAHERLWPKLIEDENGCWIFTASLGPNGYGQIRSDNTMRRAHRIAWEFFYGPVPDGLQLDHLCRVRACCNPWHLEPVTPLVNYRRGETQSSKTHCPQGHPYDEANTSHVVTKGGYPSRDCRACNRARDFRRRWPNGKPEVELRPHGTHAAYARHVRAGEVPCEPCKAGHLAYRREREGGGRREQVA